MQITANKVAVLVLGAVFICAGAAVPVAPAHAADAKQTVSKVAAKPLKAAQDAMKAKKYTEMLAKLKEVEALPGKSAYDVHLMNEMLGYAYVKLNKYPDAAKVLEADLDSGFVPAKDVPTRVRQLLQINYQLKNYDKVVDLGTRTIKAGNANDDIYTWVGQAYYLRHDYKGAARFLGSYADSQIKAGKRPSEQLLVLIQNSCDRTDDSECLQNTLEQLVRYYPKTQYWQGLVDAMYRQQSGQTDQVLLQVYRLASAVDVLKRPSDYTEFAQLALDAGSPGEAQNILERAFQNNVFTDAREQDKNRRLLDLAKKRVASSQAALPKVAAAAAAAKNGDQDVRVGVTYLGYQQYDKAIEAIQRGLAKPGVQNPAEAHLLLGIAQFRAGHKDEARKAFRAVKGNPGLERLADLWSLHTQA